MVERREYTTGGESGGALENGNWKIENGKAGVGIDFSSAVD
jgi:hypothetical protein